MSPYKAAVDVVRCDWAVPDHPRTSVEMAFLLWARACRGGDGRSGVTLRQWDGILVGQGSILLWWGVGCGGSSVHILVDDAGEHVLHLLHRILKYGGRVFCFDGGWWLCTEGRQDGKDGRDAGLCNGAY
jgi:hypothetical protein